MNEMKANRNIDKENDLRMKSSDIQNLIIRIDASMNIALADN